MSKNYDQIATVNIDISSPIVDDTSFDNLLIMGPAPAGAPKAPYAIPDVGVFSSISEVEDLGYVTTGDNADPVGVAARVAFSQSPKPTQVYIAIQKRSAEAIAASATIKDVEAAIEAASADDDSMTGCTISYNSDARRFSVVLTNSIANVSNTWLGDIVSSLTGKGYTVSTGGNKFTDVASFKALSVYTADLTALVEGGDPVSFPVVVSKDGANDVTYSVVVSYPDAISLGELDAGDGDAPIDSPDTELEAVTATIARALETSGWYVLCTAGVDSDQYEDIAAYIETQEKIFCYTEMGFFGAGEDGANKPSVGSVYFRTMGIYGRESTSQADEDVPDANWYMNVALVAKWLYYESGSETAAFKVLSSVYPSSLSSTEMKALEDANLNYFITVGNKNISMIGKVVGDEWADVIRFRDWLKSDMQLRVVNLFITRPKVPYTDSGIGLVQNQMIASLKSGQDRGGIAEEEFDEDGNSIPGYTTSVPLAASLTASEKASRKLGKCKFKARLAGAIHFAELDGSLTYEL